MNYFNSKWGYISHTCAPALGMYMWTAEGMLTYVCLFIRRCLIIVIWTTVYKERPSNMVCPCLPQAAVHKSTSPMHGLAPWQFMQQNQARLRWKDNAQFATCGRPELQISQLPSSLNILKLINGGLFLVLSWIKRKTYHDKCSCSCSQTAESNAVWQLGTGDAGLREL